ncbi:sigma-70 family RNA polymerase sigma factor [Amycolatopsis anabasis]|uniref:sigma-70 family RNA polymerase sigma factor n=1 Tax=Amycolatopsis anabasis TaxID=1840409 RepID=UPI00131D7796|nr:sigma-70 family RNA polymerase sigma factor [Amycolatopsis anabasis]
MGELEDCARRARAGDPWAWECLLRVVRERVFRWCERKLAGRRLGGHTVDDVVQEICLGVVQAVRDGGIGEEPILTVTERIAERKVTGFLLRAGRDRAVVVGQVPERADPGAGPEELAVRAEEGRMLWSVLGALSTRRRQILVLRVVRGLSAMETGELLGLTAGTVRVVQHRALCRVRELVGRRFRGLALDRSSGVPYSTVIRSRKRALGRTPTSPSAG